jgi:uncharacterized membrane protein (UPF0127 family)
MPRTDRTAARTRCLLGILIACSVVSRAQADADFKSASEAHTGQTSLSYPRSSLQIHSASGRQDFNVQIADTSERQELGLMFVMSLLPDQGMLFPVSPPRAMTMWMKNTFIPLDMLFIDAHGHIVCLRERTRPRSLDLISCDRPVSAVLEIAGGEAAARQIRIGDLVTGPAARR